MRLKGLADIDPHEVYADADMPLDESKPVKDRIDNFFDDLEAGIDKKIKEIRGICIRHAHQLRYLCKKKDKQSKDKS